MMRPCLRIALIFALCSWPLSAQADPPRVQQLRVQKVGKTTYFHLVLAPPADLRWAKQDSRFLSWHEWQLARLPRLLPQDGKTWAVYARMPDERDYLIDVPKAEPVDAPAKKGDDVPPPPQPAPPPDEPINILVTINNPDTLEFVGKVEEKAGKAKLLLQYPILPGGVDKALSPGKLLQRQAASWVEVELWLDFATARMIDVDLAPGTKDPFKRKRDSWPRNNDLEGSWAVAQGRYFTMLQNQAPEFAFYSLAREMTSQKYLVPTPDYYPPGRSPKPRAMGDSFFLMRQMYEITTGAAAITESLAHKRMLFPKYSVDSKRNVDVGRLRGVTAVEHPWLKMMAGKKPVIEPLARLIPHDNYYIHFRNLLKFLETGDLIDQWADTLSRAFEPGGRDFRLKDRLEQQLCLKSSKLARVFGPTVVKSIALTGSDPYLREGSDLTVLFHVANKALFLVGVEPYVKQALANFGGKLNAQSYHDIVIESFVTPLREVSMHRAAFGDFVVYSNSPAGIRRVIDVHLGKSKTLAESPDFQYLRTVFPVNDPLEDGFLFVPDAFLRNLAGPALRIKERRRLEALTTLSMINNGALFMAWETGRLPASHDQLLSYTGLKANQLFTPDGAPIVWDAERKLAVSGFYNTLSFATPLIEIAIDKITATEEHEYEQFRREYMGQWRQYADPFGMRIKLGESEAGPDGQPGTAVNEVRWETLPVPQVHDSDYAELRRLAGDGVIRLEPGMFQPKTIVQLVTHLSPNVRDLPELRDLLQPLAPDVPGLNWLGNRLSIRIDDSPVYAKLVQRALMREIDRGSVKDVAEDVRLVFQMPVTVGLEIRNPLVFAGVLAALKNAANEALPGAVDWEPLKEKYKGTPIVEIKARADGPLGAFGLGKAAGGPFAPALYYALVDGSWFISLRQECIQDEIDAALARKKGKNASAPVNSSVYISPQAALHAGGVLQQYLEWETQRRALANANLLLPLYHGKIVSSEDDAATIQRVAVKFLGFMPTSPDNTPFQYDLKTDEIVSNRHGNLRRPRLHDKLDPESPLARLIEQSQTLRADLHFRADGLHAVVTFTRK